MTCELCIIASNDHVIQSKLATVWSIIFSYLEMLQENYLANKVCYIMKRKPVIKALITERTVQPVGTLKTKKTTNTRLGLTADFIVGRFQPFFLLFLSLCL